jgi:hypothetical protein
MRTVSAVRISFAVVVTASCAPSKPAPETASPATTTAPVDPAAAPAPSPATAVGDPHPAGVVMPAVGRAVRMQTGDSSTAFEWIGEFVVDPADPRVQAKIAEVDGRRAHDQKALTGAGVARGDAFDDVEPLPAGAAGVRLYMEQVRAARIRTSDEGYALRDGLQVIVTIDEDQPDRFSIIVATPGG